MIWYFYGLFSGGNWSLTFPLAIFIWHCAHWERNWLPPCLLGVSVCWLGWVNVILPIEVFFFRLGETHPCLAEESRRASGRLAASFCKHTGAGTEAVYCNWSRMALACSDLRSWVPSQRLRPVAALRTLNPSCVDQWSVTRPVPFSFA